MNKRNLIIYRIVTALFTVMILMGVGMYFFQHDMAVQMWEALGFPGYLVYPVAIAKLLGLVAIWTNQSKILKEWAYAGFVFELLLGLGAHIAAGDGEFGGAAIALVLALASYILNVKVYGAKAQEAQA